MIKKVLMKKPCDSHMPVEQKHFVVPVCSEEFLKGCYCDFWGEHIENKFEEKYKSAGGKLPLGAVIHVKHPNGKNIYYGIVVYSKESGYIEDDKIKNALNSITLPKAKNCMSMMLF